MKQAFLIYGNSDRFRNEVMAFRSFIVGETDAKVIKEWPTAYAGEEFLALRLGRAIAYRTKDPLIVVFNGHGSEYGWAMDDDRRVYYRDVAKMLTQGKRPVTLVNDTCHSMALAAELEKARVSPERVSLIAASEADATACGGLLTQVAHIWRQRKAHPSGPKTRWGAVLDHHFFAKPPSDPP